MRQEIYSMFTDYSQPFKLKWGRIFASSRNIVLTELEKLAQRYACVQQDEQDFVIWRNKQGRTEAMFSILADNKDTAAIGKIFSKIQQEKSPLTFVIVEQYGDSPGNYDIFRLSEISFLEHNNRVRYRPRSK